MMYKNSGSPLLFFHRMFASFRCLHFSFMHVFFSPTPDDDGATLLVRLDGVCGFAIVVSRDVLLSSPLVVVVKVVLVVVPPALREEEEEEEEEIRI